MPMLLSTPECWFRTRQCDFYEIRLTKGRKKLPKELLTWFKENLKQPQVHVLGPSEHSGWICGGGGMAAIAMEAPEVQLFNKRWEDGNGKSNDLRWQCWQWSFAQWRRKFDHIEVFKGLPPTGTQYRWLLCDAGLYWLRGNHSEEQDPTNEFVGLPSMDDWWWVCQKYPEVLDATRSRFCMGYDTVGHAGHRCAAYETYVRENDDVSYESLFFDEDKKQESIVRAVLQLPADVKIDDNFF